MQCLVLGQKMLSKLMPPVDENQLQQQKQTFINECVWRHLALLLIGDTT